MARPCFYFDGLRGQHLVLDEDTSKHIVGVLRMENGSEILLTDGQGARARAVITDANRKRCGVDLVKTESIPPLQPAVTIGISLVKNSARFEWFLEKATEIGVTAIIPLLCARTEKEKFRMDRMRGILTSALLQSQQSWMPLLHEPTAFETVIREDHDLKFIAHCLEEVKAPLTAELQQGNPAASRLLLIGPEGDFTPVEIQSALARHFLPVSLGPTRLRTETAGLVAATLLRNS